MQNWPNDPDVLAREQQIANASKRTVGYRHVRLVDPGFRLPKQKVASPTRNRDRRRAASSALTGNKKEQQKLIATAKSGAAGQVDANGNPIRTALTEPPAEYRVPDPTAPEEFEAASKRGLGLFKKKTNAPWPSEMGGGTDDIADPDVSPARISGTGGQPLRASKNRLSRAADSLPLIPE